MYRKKKSTNLFLLPMLLVTVFSLTLGPLPLFSQAVLTRSYDNLRSGSNTQEKDLTPVSVGSLRKLQRADSRHDRWNVAPRPDHGPGKSLDRAV